MIFLRHTGGKALLLFTVLGYVQQTPERMEQSEEAKLARGHKLSSQKLKKERASIATPQAVSFE